ncbi:amidase [Sinosporangium siamense]|uniref:N-acetylmuramoyl-L-alanine amidase n=2 Tax=Sinosporangium siamense TaxID=1367973 RepID=A0A919RAP8_9ACTN|nr:amidase [Sinosporangium siamense]
MSIATSAVVASAAVLISPALVPHDPAERRAPAAPAAATRHAAFAKAAGEFGVPVSVLLGVSYLHSRWDSHAGLPSTSGGYGPMHLIDLPAARRDTALPYSLGNHHDDDREDPRGDPSRPMPRHRHQPPKHSPAAPRTLMRAAELTGIAPERLRRDPDANIRGGAALLADHQRALGGHKSANPADWYDAVAAYGGDPAGSTGFADEVFGTIQAGAARTTDDGFALRLGAHPALGAHPTLGADRDRSPRRYRLHRNPGPDRQRPKWGKKRRGGHGRHDRPARRDHRRRAECPESLACEWMPAAYARTGRKSYGNHDRLHEDRKIDYIVIHDTEGSFRGVPSMVNNPRYVSWHYTIRSEDGHVAQHVRTGDIAWHAGNWDINSRSIGIEHEGYLARGGTWYTEAMYRASAKLVRHLADEHDIPLDRAHIIGHDNVPGITPDRVRGMHVDPGPYWDWARFFALLDAPFTATGEEDATSVIIRPDFEHHQAQYTGCTRKQPARHCKRQGSASVWLHTEPSHHSPLVKDIGKHGGGASTHSVYDHAGRASTGQRYAVADRQGDWTAIWYLNQKAWFHNPASSPTALPADGPLVTPRAGLDSVKVYGRAYPEADAYPGGIRPEKLVPLQYTLRPGRRYTLGLTIRSAYTRAKSVDPREHVIIRGRLRYHQIQLGHRVMFVKADDVEIIDR